MKVELHRLTEGDFRAKHAGFHRAASGHNADRTEGWVDVIPGKGGDELLGHELWHLYRAGNGNDSHHPWWHFCIPSLNPIRFWFWPCEDHRLKGWARELRQNGTVTLP